MPYEGQTVRLLVVDDPALAEAVRGLQADWKDRSGAGLTVKETTAAEVSNADKIDADAVVYPSHLLGVLAEKGLLEPLPPGLFSKDNQQLDWDQVFAAVRQREVTWGSQTLALPLGSRVLVCYYRADLLKKLQKPPPRTWDEYQQLAAFFADGKNLGDAAPQDGQPWFAAAEPLAEGWAGITLLARAAAYAKHRDYYSALFDLQTMEPRIAEAPFVRALEELVAANSAKKGEQALLDATPTDTVDRVWWGQCPLALGWARARNEAVTTEESPPLSIEAVAVGCVPLPGSAESYNWGKGRYVDIEARGVPLLACSGRFGSLSAPASHPQAAAQLLIELSGTEWGVRVSSASTATAPFRASQLSQATRWLHASRAGAARPYAQAVADSLASDEVVYALRIPGRRQYLDALDKAVRQAVQGKASPKEALEQAAACWREITEELGLDAQRKACEHSVVRLAF